MHDILNRYPEKTAEEILNSLSKKGKQTLMAIASFIDAQNLAGSETPSLPSNRALMRLLNLKSSNTIVFRLLYLEKKGLIINGGSFSNVVENSLYETTGATVGPLQMRSALTTKGKNVMKLLQEELDDKLGETNNE